MLSDQSKIIGVKSNDMHKYVTETGWLGWYIFTMNAVLIHWYLVLAYLLSCKHVQRFSDCVILEHNVKINKNASMHFCLEAA